MSHQDLLKAAEKAALATQEALMTLAEQLRQEGRQECRQEGRQEGQIELLAKQLQLKFGKLSADSERRIASASGEDLERWGEQVLTANSLEEVLGDLA